MKGEETREDHWGGLPRHMVKDRYFKHGLNHTTATTATAGSLPSRPERQCLLARQVAQCIPLVVAFLVRSSTSSGATAAILPRAKVAVVIVWFLSQLIFEVELDSLTPREDVVRNGDAKTRSRVLRTF